MRRWPSHKSFTAGFLPINWRSRLMIFPVGRRILNSKLEKKGYYSDLTRPWEGLGSPKTAAEQQQLSAYSGH